MGRLMWLFRVIIGPIWLIFQYVLAPVVALTLAFAFVINVLWGVLTGSRAFDGKKNLGVFFRWQYNNTKWVVFNDGEFWFIPRW